MWFTYEMKESESQEKSRKLDLLTTKTCVPWSKRRTHVSCWLLINKSFPFTWDRLLCYEENLWFVVGLLFQWARTWAQQLPRDFNNRICRSYFHLLLSLKKWRRTRSAADDVKKKRITKNITPVIETEIFNKIISGVISCSLFLYSFLFFLRLFLMVKEVSDSR